MASIEIFCCYARKDQPLLQELKVHLFPLQRQGIITLWNDTDISPGANWEEEIEKHLNTAQIILLLVSPDFIASEYCYSKELQRAMKRHEVGEVHVIPIILRPVIWKNMLFGHLEALPTDAKPITSSLWHNLDEALFDVAQGIEKLIHKFLQEQQEQQEQASVDLSTYFESKAIPTGFKDLDRLIGGLQRSDLIIVEAPPSTGKTCFALSLALNVAVKHSYSIGIYSLEMSRELLVQRLLSMEADFELQRLRMGMEQMDDDELERVINALGRISDAKICIYDSADLTIAKLQRLAWQMMHDCNIDLIIVDYVDLIQTDVAQSRYGNKGQGFHEISRCLKVIARELNVPVVALAQRTRRILGYEWRAPQLSDTHDASIEHDADIVVYIYREDMHNPETERANLADLIVDKHRNGPRGEISLYFHPRTGYFRDLIVTE